MSARNGNRSRHFVNEKRKRLKRVRTRAAAGLAAKGAGTKTPKAVR